MAENISTSDIQRAVQSAVHNMCNDVSRISHVLDGMNRVGMDVKDLTRRLARLEQETNQIQNTIAYTLGRPATRRHPDPYVAEMANDIRELKIRFAAIERFAAQVSEYIRKRDEATKEDRQYRTA